jgi:hypothetical protein
VSKRWRKGQAAAHAARTSWSIKWGRKDENGEVRRWRQHVNASLQRQGTPAEHEQARTAAHESARALAKKLTQDPDVVWVTVYPPLRIALFGKGTGRLAPISRWKRSTGWTTEEDN